MKIINRAIERFPQLKNINFSVGVGRKSKTRYEWGVVNDIAQIVSVRIFVAPDESEEAVEDATIWEISKVLGKPVEYIIEMLEEAEG